MKTNEKGFSLVEALLILVVIGLVGGTGWYVWQSKHKTNNAELSTAQTPRKQTKVAKDTSAPQTVKPADETQSWTLFTSSKGWQLNIPDGWKLFTDTSSAGLTAYSPLKYAPGTKAVIEATSSGRGGPFVLNAGSYAAGDPASAVPEYLTGETVFKAKNIEGRKYVGTLTEDVPMDGSKGDTKYWYVFVKDTRSVIFQHHHAKDTNSIVVELEKALATLELK